MAVPCASYAVQVASENRAGEGAVLKAIVDKVTLDRLRDRDLQVSLLCPYCKTARIVLDAAHSTGSLNGVDCPKCGVHILLDSVSLVVIKDPVVVPKA
jgi:DNA-directed RNA polymerase subunit RPC12/RpoP